MQGLDGLSRKIYSRGPRRAFGADGGFNHIDLWMVGQRLDACPSLPSHHTPKPVCLSLPLCLGPHDHVSSLT